MEEAKIKSTIQTSRKVYVFKIGMIHVEVVTFLYAICKIANVEVDGNIFISAIGAAALIIGTLNIADGIKKGE